MQTIVMNNQKTEKLGYFFYSVLEQLKTLWENFF